MYAKSALTSLIGFALLSVAATASADYEIWYVPDTAIHAHQYGDVTVNHVKMTPPAWACGLWFKDPNYLNWKVGYQNNGIDLEKDVYVWINHPGAGCPHNDLLIEYADHSQQFPHLLGAEIGQILSHVYAPRWVDAAGKTHSFCCSNIKLKWSAAKWNVMPLNFSDLKSSLADPNQQRNAYRLAVDVQTDVSALGAELSDQIALRRRTPSPDSEASLREMEDAATYQMAIAARQIANSVAQTRAGQYADAYCSADLAAQALAAASQQADVAQGMISD